MAITDFLNNGQIPTGSAVKSMTSQTVLPEWYTNYAMQLLSNQNALLNRPYETAPMPRVAGFTPQQQQGFNMTGTAATSFQPGLTAATQATQNAMTAPGGTAAAQPYMQQAGQSSVANIGQYMNPYTQQVVDQIATLGARNLNENIMPGIEGRYIQSGQLGYGARDGSGTPSGMLTDTARAIRDTQNDILAKQAEALQSGYTQAANLASGDLSRYGDLATLAGNLTNADLSRLMGGAEQLSGLAAAQQALGLKGAEAVTGVGAQQQELNQKNLDLAYADWLRQQGYPQEQINAALGTLKGIAAAVPTASTEEGIMPSGVADQGKISTANAITGALTGIGGMLASANEGSALSRLLGFG